MTGKTKELQAAEWLVVGYAKCWTWRMFAITLQDATGGQCKDFDFLPDSLFWRGNVLVRAYVAQNWPKLNAYLDTATPEKAIKAAKEITKLKWNGCNPTGSLTRKERSEVDKARIELGRATTAYNYSQKMFRQGAGKYRGALK